MRFPAFLAAASAVFLTATPALAHPKLVTAQPAPNGVIGTTSRLQLTFSERLIERFSGADLVMTGMVGMKAHAPMCVPVKAALAADGVTLVLTPARPLSSGTYRIDWHVVSADTHRVSGGYSFRIK
jgi:copper resistance protein C